MGEVKFCGYLPGAIGRITELHATYYSEHWGYNLKFEAEVATELSEFLLHFDEAVDGFWLAVVDSEIVGSIAIKGSQDSTQGARLRWFIIAPEWQGQGIGKALMEKAIAFCKRVGFSRVYLWTATGLDAAHHLYKKWGFTLCQEYEDGLWGERVTHQMFELYL